VDEGQRRSVGRVVKVLREAAGLSRDDLAARTAESPSQRLGREMLAKVEQGRKAPSPVSVAKIARALGVPTAELARSAARWESGAAMGVHDAALRQELLAVMRPSPPPVVETGVELDALLPRGRRADLVRQLERRVRDLAARGSVEQLENAVLALQAQDRTAPVRLASIDIDIGTGIGFGPGASTAAG
jgi:transcriptional regulator with XRE-family HTH domain